MSDEVSLLTHFFHDTLEISEQFAQSQGFVWIYTVRSVCVCELMAMHSLSSIYTE